MKDPVIVLGEGEEIILSKEEREISKLGPKFCTYKNLLEEDFEADIEECILKIKWDMMSDENKGEPGLEDKALEVLLGEEVCQQIDEENEEEREMMEGEMRTIFDWKTRTL